MGENMDARLRDALMAADDAFWAQIARAYPEITTGDLDPGATHAFATAAEDVVRAWLYWNAPQEDR